MKKDTEFDWDDIVSSMVNDAIDAHKFFGKDTEDGKKNPRECLLESLKALEEDCLNELEEILNSE